MNPLRRLLLRASESRFLAERLPRLPAVRRSVRRFVPGESVEEALEAARELEDEGLHTVLTRLGENVENPGDAAEATRHYREVLDRVAKGRERSEISVKLTHLGLDLAPDRARRNLETLAARAKETGNFVWVDMERSPYVDPTLRLFRRVREEHGAVGLCLQAYLYRTPSDLQALLAEGSSVRLVKGAYDEPEDVAYPGRSDVDAAYVELAREMLRSALRDGVRHGFATHDDAMIEAVAEDADELGVERGAYEFQMLYGIRSGLQRRLAGDDHAVRTLISYGSEWFAWYLRRLAERPANLGFVLRNLFRS